MHNQLLLRATVIVFGTLSIAASCNPGEAAPWKCFTVDTTTPPPPHASGGDKYCVSQQGTAWNLVPGQGMEDWTPIGGTGTQIPLTVVTDSAAVKIWDFEVEITGHPVGSDHGPQHVKPNRGYRLQVNIPGGPNPKAVAVIRVAGPPGDPIHGGTAHGVED